MSILLATIRSDVAFRFADKSNGYISNTEIDRWAGSIQADIARKVKFLKQDKGFVLTAGSPWVAMPSDFIKLDSAISYQTMLPLSMLPRSKWYRIPDRAAGFTQATPPYIGYLEYTRVNASTLWRLFTWPIPSSASITTTLNGAINASVTSITLTDSSSFPAAGRIIIENEEIYYSGNAANVLSPCVRGVGATIGASHNNATTVTRADLVCAYTRLPVTMDSTTPINAEIPDEDYETLISGILAIAFESGKEKELAAFHEGRYKAGIAEMKIKFSNPDEENDNQIQSNSDYEWTRGSVMDE